MENVGAIIKGMAIFVFIIELVSAVIWFLYFIVSGSLSLLSLVPPACLFLLSFISYFLVYGFGQLVENSDMLVANSDIMVTHLSDEFEVIDHKRE